MPGRGRRAAAVVGARRQDRGGFRPSPAGAAGRTAWRRIAPSSGRPDNFTLSPGAWAMVTGCHARFRRVALWGREDTAG